MALCSVSDVVLEEVVVTAVHLVAFRESPRQRTFISFGLGERIGSLSICLGADEPISTTQSTAKGRINQNITIEKSHLRWTEQS